MSFSANSLIRKLDDLQETQDSIVSISNWILFHQKHIKQITEIWLDYIMNHKQSDSKKKLSLLYLCNDVVQQARSKRKQQFLDEFINVLPRALPMVYQSVDSSIKPKIERLLGVWQQRKIYSPQEIDTLKQTMKKKKTNNPDSSKEKTTSTSTPAALGSSSSSSIAPELKHINELFTHLNKLTEISQTNLSQFGNQSKTYLPDDPLQSENLPSPETYISKLNSLEGLSKLLINNIEEIKSTKLKIKSYVDNLSNLLIEGCKTEETKIGIINEKLLKLNQTRNELKSMLEYTNQDEDEEEEESPTYQALSNDEEDDSLPTYEQDNDSDQEEPELDELDHPVKKRKISPTPSGGSTPSSAKRVAFSEDIEVKEYDQDDETNENESNYTEPESEEIANLIHTHKDLLELKHEHDELVNSTNGVDNNDNNEYDPSVGNGNSDSSSGPTNDDVMSLLSKLVQN